MLILLKFLSHKSSIKIISPSILQKNTNLNNQKGKRKRLLIVVNVLYYYIEKSNSFRTLILHPLKHKRLLIAVWVTVASVLLLLGKVET